MNYRNTPTSLNNLESDEKRKNHTDKSNSPQKTYTKYIAISAAVSQHNISYLYMMRKYPLFLQIFQVIIILFLNLIFKYLLKLPYPFPWGRIASGRGDQHNRPIRKLYEIVNCRICTSFGMSFRMIESVLAFLYISRTNSI